MLKDVAGARATGGYRIYLRFEDGVEGEIDLSTIVDFRGVFETLKDPDEVARVRVDRDLGTICWESGADLDPDVLYAQVTGTSIDLRSTAARAS